MPVDKTVRLSEGVLSFEEKVAYKDASCALEDKYDLLIERGVEKLIENSSAAISGSEFETVVVDLTAGKDSRIVFGAVINNKEWGDRVRINTIDTPGDDLSVSCGISNLFGAKFYEGDETPQAPMTLEEGLNFWRSYYFGQYHRFACGAWSNRGLNRSELAVGGANGEIYRSFWCDVVSRHLNMHDTVADFSQSLVNSSAIPSFYDKERLQSVTSIVAEELDSLQGRTISEKIEEHYLFHRNRAHCGLRGFTFYHDRLTWYPLQAADLLSASRAISFSDRAKNRVIFDVLERLHPVLPELRFGGGNPFNDLPRVQNRLIGTLPLTMNESRDRWIAATAVAKEKIIKRRQGRNPTMKWSDLPSFMSDKFIDAATALMNSKYSHLVPNTLIDEFERLMKNNTRSAYQFASRVFYVHDALL
ncbi:hypothetical protein D9M70_395600 [compost metagenome]